MLIKYRFDSESRSFFTKEKMDELSEKLMKLINDMVIKECIALLVKFHKRDFFIIPKEEKDYLRLIILGKEVAKEIVEDYKEHYKIALRHKKEIQLITTESIKEKLNGEEIHYLVENICYPKENYMMIMNFKEERIAFMHEIIFGYEIISLCLEKELENQFYGIVDVDGKNWQFGRN